MNSILERRDSLGLFSALAMGVMIALAASSCATTAEVSVSSIAEESVTTSSKVFNIVPAQKSVKEKDLEFQKFAEYTANALESKGIKRTGDTSKDYLIVTLAYGVGEPEKSVTTYSAPVYGGFGYGVYPTVVPPMGYMGPGMFAAPGATAMAVPIGQQTVVEEQIEYRKYIVITAYQYDPRAKENKGHRDAKMVWQTRITSAGESDDLGKLFPYMLAAGLDKLATNDEEPVLYDISVKNDKNPKVCQVKDAKPCNS